MATLNFSQHSQQYICYCHKKIPILLFLTGMRRPPWFLEIAFVQEICMHVCVCARVRVCVCMCVCVCPPWAMETYSHEMKPEITNQTIPTAFQFAYMALAVNITNGRGLSNEERH